MGEQSKIEWTDATWNPVTGCSPVSAGCANCYAATVTHRFACQKRYAGLTHDGQFNGTIKLHPNVLQLPLRWRKGRMVFVCSMSDLFHPDVQFEFIDKIWAVMALSSKHTFQVLTKRPERLWEWFNRGDVYGKIASAAAYVRRITGCKASWWPRYEEGSVPLPNVWIGTTAEDQKCWNARVRVLRQIPAAVRFVSCEPLLERVNPIDSADRPIDWLIIGGESGPGARPMRVDWVYELRNACEQVGRPFFFKQWGAWCRQDQFLPGEPSRAGVQKMSMPDGTYYRVGKKRAGRRLDGRLFEEWPQTY